MDSQTHSTPIPSVRSSSGEHANANQPGALPLPLTVQSHKPTARQAAQEEKPLMEEIPQGTTVPAHWLSRMEHRLTRLLFNLFPLAVVAAFFWLQVQIDTQNTGLLHTLVIIMTVLVELAVIFVWSLFI